MRVLLLRHGQTPSNVHGLLDTGAPGPSLTRLGERQAAAVPDSLDGRRIDAVAVSPLLRTTLTATPLLHRRGLETLTHEGLREIEAGDLEMSGDPAAHAQYLQTVFAWARGELTRHMPGGPDGETFYTRFDEAIGSLASSGAESLVVVSHGAAIRTWAGSRVQGLTPATMEHRALGNTGAVDIEGDPDAGWQLVGWSQEPIGGRRFGSETAEDPTGEAAEEIAGNAAERTRRAHDR